MSGSLPLVPAALEGQLATYFDSLAFLITSRYGRSPACGVWVGLWRSCKGEDVQESCSKKKSTSSSQNVLWLIRNSRWNNKAFSLFPSYGLFCDTVPQLPVWWCPMVCLPRDRPGSTTWSEVVASGVTCPCTVLHPALFISFPSHSCIPGMVSTKITH